jgi:hypothetical protein
MKKGARAIVTSFGEAKSMLISGEANGWFSANIMIAAQATKEGGNAGKVPDMEVMLKEFYKASGWTPAASLPGRRSNPLALGTLPGISMAKGSM